MSVKLDNINKRISKLIRERNDILHKLRENCEHLRLIELSPNCAAPMRMCVDCGAEEEGWYCGYRVLVIRGDTWDTPHKEERVLVERTTASHKFYKYRKNGPSYPVGQSHPNFSRDGIRSYKQLTEILQ